MSQPSLRPQDVVVLAKLFSYQGRRPSIAQMALELSISPSEVHASLNRLMASNLVSKNDKGGHPLPGATEEFLIHGVKYAFPAKRGEITRGVLTSYAAPPLAQEIVAGSELPPVWPFSEGQDRGVSLEPLYRTVPAAALKDSGLYELLALIDAIRNGRARERQLAQKKLSERLRRKLDGRSQPRDARSSGQGARATS